MKAIPNKPVIRFLPRSLKITRLDGNSIRQKAGLDIIQTFYISLSLFLSLIICVFAIE